MAQAPLRYLFIIGFLTLQLACVPRLGRVRPPATEAWIELSSANFTLYSDASEMTTRQVALQLERLHATLARTTAGRQLRPATPVRVFLFGKWFSYQPYKDLAFPGSGPGLVGFFIRKDYDNYMVIFGGGGVSPVEVIYHEYIHYFLSNTLPAPPLWLNEGIAEVYTTFLTTPAEIRIGRPVQEHVEYLRGTPLIPLEELFAVTTSSPVYNEARRQGRFYAQSWALAHYLLLGKEAHRQQSTVFLTLLKEGVPQREALEQAYHMDVRQLQSELEKYVRQSSFAYEALDATAVPVPADARVAPMKHEDVLYHLGDFLSQLENRAAWGEAELHFREALKLDPQHGDAYSGLGTLQDRLGQPAEAVQLFEKAVALEPGSYVPYLRYGESILRRYFEQNPSFVPFRTRPIEIDRARTLFRRSVALNPALVEGYVGLGKTFLFETGELAEGIRALEKVRELAPGRLDAIYALIFLYAQQGDLRQAGDLLDNFLARGSDAFPTDNARRFIWQKELEQADRMIRSDQVQEGMAILHRVRTEATDPALQSRIDHQIEEVERYLASRRHVEMYNAAVQLARSSRLGEALEKLDRLLAETRDPQMKASAQALKDKLELSRSQQRRR